MIVWAKKGNKEMLISGSKLKNWLIYDRRYMLPRLWSNAALRDICPLFNGEVINVSGWDDRDKEGGCYRDYFTHASAYYLSNYSGERGLADASGATDFEIDLSSPVSDEYKQRFDAVLNHTTLEHIFDVRVAFSNLCKMSKDVVIVVVPFIQELHCLPSFGDYWRFTPLSLRQLFQENKFSVIFEAVTPDRNAGTYLLFIGSRHPEKWQTRLPKWQEITVAGSWVGRRRINILIKVIAKVAKGLRCLAKKMHVSGE